MTRAGWRQRREYCSSGGACREKRGGRERRVEGGVEWGVGVGCHRSRRAQGMLKAVLASSGALCEAAEESAIVQAGASDGRGMARREGGGLVQYEIVE